MKRINWFCVLGVCVWGQVAAAADTRLNGETTEYRQDLIALANGTLTVDGVSVGQTTEWTSGSETMAVVPVPDVGYEFSAWKGTLTGLTPAADGTLALPKNAAHRLIALFVKTSAAAKTRTWTGAVSSDWNDDGNWTDGSATGKPVEGDHVTIPASKSVTLDRSTPLLGSLNVSGTLLTTNWETCVRAGNVCIPSNGKISVAGGSTDDQTNRVWIACDGLYIATGGKIDVNDLGFLGSKSKDSGDPFRTNGPGKSNNRALGASHGGYGASTVTSADCGVSGFGGKALNILPYDDPAKPILPGSSGCRDTYGSATSGGGAVYVSVTRQAVVDGKVLASASKTAGRGSSGSGGAVYLKCSSFSSRGGEIRADGSNGTAIFDALRYGWGAVGGGGMIAIDYLASSQKADYVSDMIVSAGPGRYSDTDAPYGDAKYALIDAGLGTVWLPDDELLPSLFGKGLTGVLVNMTEDYEIDGDCSFTSGYVRLPKRGVKLTVKGDMTISGSLVRLDVGGLYATNSVMFISIYGGDQLNEMVVEGNLTLTSGGRLDLRSAETNATLQIGARLSVGGLLTVGADASLHCWSDPSNMGSPKIEVGSLDVQEDGLISGFLHGCSIKQGLNRGSNNGYGGPHGGSAGRSGYDSSRPKPYDDARFPTLPGTGAGGTSGYSVPGVGGGVVHIEVKDEAVVNGVINANGANGQGTHTGGGGGGGTININCKSFSGAGSLLAEGGASVPALNSSGGGGGGGGRIAVWTRWHYYEPSMKDRYLTTVETSPESFSGTMSVAGGLPYGSGGKDRGASVLDVTQYPQYVGEDGTFRWTQVARRPGLKIMFR